MIMLTLLTTHPHSRGPRRGRPIGLLVAWVLLGITALGVTGLGAGCAHYGFADADRRGQNAGQATISVWTVATPADEGMDAARLTRALVGALDERGLSARWRADASSTSLRCSVTRTDVDAFDQTLFAEARVRCRFGGGRVVDDDFDAIGRITASTRLGSASLVAGHAGIQEAAAIDALEVVADQMARRELASE